MAVHDKIRQLLALARSTTFAGERANALALARTLCDKHRIDDARLRWEVLTALGQEAGPEPLRPGEPQRGTPAWATAFWEQWAAAEADERAQWSHDLFVRWQRQQQAEWAWTEEREHAEEDGAPPRPPRSRTRSRHRRQRVRVRSHWSDRSDDPIPGYSRTITSRTIRFTCQQCGDRVTQERFPGPAPVYCSADCKQEAQRVQTRERVRRYRERQAR